jgi:hypothetical protein
MDAATILASVTDVTKHWAKQRKAEERRSNSEARRLDALTRRRRITFKDASWEVIPDAYHKASSGKRYPAHARQVMYAGRGEIQRITGMEKLDDKYFCQVLLPDYLAEHPDETADWDIVFDARGHFEEPHTKLIVPLGTLDVRAYLSDIESAKEEDLLNISNALRIPTCGPSKRYSAILFIEKEGFNPLFEAAHLAEHYDLAIMSTKGFSVTASRLLVDQLCSVFGMPLLALHDFDKAGFSIIGTLRRDTRRYTFRNRIDVRDLGLRLTDVNRAGLQSESCAYSSDPTENLLKNGATMEEIRFLYSGHRLGQRVELNAFTSGQFITWIEAKLAENGIKKLIPDQSTLEFAFRRATEIELLNRRLKEFQSAAHDEAAGAPLPRGLVRMVRARLAEQPELSWDAGVGEIAASRFCKNR